MTKVYYNWKKVYLYPSFLMVSSFVLFIGSLILVLSNDVQDEIRIIIPILSASFFIVNLSRYLSVVKRATPPILINGDTLRFKGAIINSHQIESYELYDNGLGEIHTSVFNARSIIISMDMINYQNLVDWLEQIEIEEEPN